MIRDWAQLAFHPWREISTSLQESIEMHENDIERNSLWLFMHRALILPLWWMRCHHTPWSIHAWKIEVRVWEKFLTNWDESSWANHDHEMRISWAWWDDDLGLHVFTPSSTFISNLYFLSLVLPCSCSFREKEEGEKWENGLRWCCFSWVMVTPISCIWHVGPRVEWRTAQSPLTACNWGTDGLFGMTLNCLVFSVGWEMGPNSWELALRPINFVPKVNNLTSNNLSQCSASFRLRVALLGRKAMYPQFLLCPNACRVHLGASSVIKIESLGCSELRSLQT
jgi:hypothetical protein